MFSKCYPAYIFFIHTPFISFKLTYSLTGTKKKGSTTTTLTSSDGQTYSNDYLEYTYDYLGEKVTTKRCDDISKYYYDNIDDYEDTIEVIVDALGGDNVDVKTIECGSNYLVISLFSLILLFI